MPLAETLIFMVIAYVLGSVVTFFIGRQMGIKIGAVLTFDLFARLGYVKYFIDEQGEVVLQKVGESDHHTEE
jgi:membrane protein DedA with SNARE-associated domain